MRLRLTVFVFLVLCTVAAVASAASLEDLRAAIFERPASGAPASTTPEPLDLAAMDKAICTQNFCPGGGYVSCQTYPPYDTCKVKCGGVKCEGQEFIKCPNPCCTRTITCWDGSVVTCRNWRATDCSLSGEGVECDGVCPPPEVDPCYGYPFNCQ